MKTIRQFAHHLAVIKNSFKIAAASSLALSAAVMIPAAPAQAISFTGGELDFGVFTSAFGSSINPSVATNFVDVTFNPSGTTSIFRADGSFSPTFTAGTTIGSNSPTVRFSNTGSNIYRLNQDLVINFNAATPTSFTLGQNSTFVETEIFDSMTGLRTGAGLQLASPASAFFTNGGINTPIPTVAFSLTDTGLPSGGLYITQTSPTSVPEPFTVIGSIVGGTAAFRMRKKLANINKN
jgi:hypothetical protein